MDNSDIDLPERTQTSDRLVDQSFGQVSRHPQPIYPGRVTTVNWADVVLAVDAALPSRPEGGSMSTVVAGEITTHSAPTSEVRVGDHVRRQGLPDERSVEVTELPVRHGSVWMIRGYCRLTDRGETLYPLACEDVLITRGSAASADPRRAADVAWSRAYWACEDNR